MTGPQDARGRCVRRDKGRYPLVPGGLLSGGRTGYGSSIAEGKDIRHFDGKPYVLERAITTDFALIRAAKADQMGNLVFRGGSQNFNVSFAKAAR